MESTIAATITSDEAKMLGILRSSGLDVDITIYKRDGRIVNVDTTVKHAKAFKSAALARTEDGGQRSSLRD